MKKITFIILLCAGFTYGQTPTSYTEVSANNAASTSGTSSEGTIIRQDNNRPIVGTYTSLSEFNDAVTANCSDPNLTSEDFGGGPGGITNCGTIISSSGDNCFAPGELQDGFSSFASETSMINIPPGAIGNVDSLIGATFFTEYTIITFSPDVYAVAMDIWENNDPVTIIRVYGAGGALIDSFDYLTPTNAQTFFGVISDEPITSIELEGANGSGELFGNFLYGGDCMQVFGISDNLQELFIIYPNPASDVLNISNPSNIAINAVVFYDTLGKSIPATLVNGQINISSLESGIYFMSINTAEGTLTQKVVKK
jgi:hypothetical protein